MNKILLIIRREYITRVRKRAFIIMTILGPIIFASFMVVPYMLMKLEDTDLKTIAVVELDESNAPVPRENLIFKNVFAEKEKLKFDYLSNVDTATIEQLVENSGYYGVLVLNHRILNQQNSEVQLYAKKQPSMGIEDHVRQSLENFLFEKKLEKMNLSPDEIRSYKTQIHLKTNRLEKGKFKEQKLVDLKRGIGYATGFLIYFFIFFFGAQVMRGVIEEKINRIVEVIVTSVRPFQLMMGKIAGIALVGLTQFLAWIILTIGIYQFAMTQFIGPPKMTRTEQFQAMTTAGMNNQMMQQPSAAPEFFNAVRSLKPSFYLYLFGTFIFYFIFGYLLYGSMFAAIGSAVDSETDTQQFMLPVTIPLIISIIVMINAITNPEGQLVFWFSIIPFTSPVVMMARIPFLPPPGELILSMVLLIITFLGMTWVAGKIYRTGILMYGKKVSYRELIKWIGYKK
jgi:ABC-2 type transport system permease protein